MDYTEYTAAKVWGLYQKGIDYLNKKHLIADTNQAWNFYFGKQWEGLKSGGIKMPYFNFIHTNVMRLVTTVFSNRLAVTYTDLEGRMEYQPIYDMLQTKYAEDYEKAKEDVRLRETLKEACITGDGVQYFGHGADASKVQRLDNTSLLYGDESEPDIQKQPYIIIHQRETVKSVRLQAKRHNLPEEDINRIVSDSDTKEIIGNKAEVDETSNTENGKVTTLIYFTKNEEGIVCTMRSTNAVVYEPFHEIRGGASMVDEALGKKGRGLRLYPILKLSWELRPNDARGVSHVQQLIPNQIELNKNIARRSMASKTCCFPHLVYLEGSVIDEAALDTVGGKIAVRGDDVNEINKLVTYMQPAQISNEPKLLSDDILEVTQQLSGSGENTLGQIDLNRVAASAINAVNERAESMLDGQVSMLAQYGEDFAALMAELHIVYEPDGFYTESKVPDPATGEEVTVRKMITQEMLDKIMPAVRVDITKENSFSIQARDKWLDDLLAANQIGLRSRVRLASEGSPIPKHEMLAELDRIEEEQRQQMMEQQQMQMPPEAAPPGNLPMA